MKEDEEKKEFFYHFRCADFELEFQGTENFMQAMIRKYENKVLTKLNQLVPGDKPQAPPAIAPVHANQPRPEPRPQPKPIDKQRFQGKHNRDRGRGPKKPMYNPKPELPQKREPDDYLKHTPTNAEISEQMESAVSTGLKINPEDIRSLNERFRPQTSHDRVMILAYYLEQKFQGEFSSPEVQECYQSLSDKVPGNLSTVLNNATRSGFLSKEEKHGKIRYRLTFKGKRYVENGLRLD